MYGSQIEDLLAVLFYGTAILIHAAAPYFTAEHAG